MSGLNNLSDQDLDALISNKMNAPRFAPKSSLADVDDKELDRMIAERSGSPAQSAKIDLQSAESVLTPEEVSALPKELQDKRMPKGLLPMGAESALSGFKRNIPFGDYANNVAALMVSGGSLNEDYVKARDEMNIRDLQLKAERPGAYKAGMGTGIATGFLAPTIAAGPGLLKGAALGAGYAGLDDPGDIAGEINPVQGTQRLMSAGVGGMVGAGAGLVAPKIQSAIKNKMAQRSGQEAFGEAIKKTPQMTDDVAEGMLSRVTAPVKQIDEVESIFRKLGDAKPPTGSLGKIYLTKNEPKKPGLIRNVISSTSRAISNVFNPERVPEYNKLVETAKRVGIDPNDLAAAAEFGSRSTISRIERGVREGPVGGKLMGTYEQNAQKVNNYLNKTLESVAGGPVAEPVSAGRIMQDAFKNAEKAVFDNVVITYKTAADLTPNMQLSQKGFDSLNKALNGIQKRAKGYISKGGTNQRVSMGKDLFGMAQRLRRNKANYRNWSDQIKEIGDAANEEGLSSTHQSELRHLYDEMRAALTDSVKEINPDLGEQLIKDNKKMSDFFYLRDRVGKTLKDTSPEKSFKQIFSDTNQILDFKEAVPSGVFDQARGAYLGALIKRNADGDILWDSTRKALSKDKGKLSVMFNDVELGDLDDLLQLGAAQGIDVLSTSGTGGSLAMKYLPDTIKEGVFNEQILESLKKRARKKAAESRK